jgi:hypothetical protein
MSVSSPVQYGVVPVGVADAVVLAGNVMRQGLLLSNPGPNAVYVAFGQPAAAGQGIALPPGSPPLVLLARDWPGLLTLDLHALCPAAAGFLAGLSSLSQTAS